MTEESKKEPEHFDAILVGTNLTQSIVAASLALSGKKILHIDQNEYYGGQDANIDLETLVSFAEHGTTPHPAIRDFSITVHDQEAYNEHINPPKARRYCLDLSPRVYYARGRFLEHIVSCALDRYVEFTLPDAQTVWTTGHNPVALPLGVKGIGDLTTRFNQLSAALGTGSVPMLQRLQAIKRLQQFQSDFSTHIRLTAPELFGVAPRPETAMAGELDTIKSPLADLIGSGALETMQDLFDHYALDTKLAHAVIVHGMLLTDAMPAAIPLDEGMASLTRYATAMGRYTLAKGGRGVTSPFVVPLYGSGELIQALCRVAAISGGVYVLKGKLDPNGDAYRVSTGDVSFHVTADAVIADTTSADSARHDETYHGIGFVMAESPDGAAKLVHAMMTPAGLVWCLQLDNRTNVCPKGATVYHIVAACADCRDAALSMIPGLAFAATYTRDGGAGVISPYGPRPTATGVEMVSLVS
ncbi:GDP dissociation inhibitor [Carpediemonas membranifera]|uniref:GDP dissociation inhibitor n=1 Tax=Carpediemonas membranifera TaxID=201153 RepID=A0A8J6B0R3_9EUKA|nr:GDP dissociation inhibitor [Carpediemonas membranifera]|eukprot:KAG9390542.1 GDP dissociation inhibitor [Carpediemonas membranifera]